MLSFTTRRVRNGAALLVALSVITALWLAERRALRPHAFHSGYLLIGAVLFLAAYNLRKKLPFLPLGSSAAWLQWHLYVGCGAAWVFLLHIGFRWPNGMLETLLAGLFSVVTLSGLVGLYLTRTLPRRLAALREEVLWERIPQLQRSTAAKVRQLVEQAATTPESGVIAEFYTQRLFPFFERRRAWHYYLRPTSVMRRRLLAQLHELPRYLAEPQRPLVQELAQAIGRKDDLDYHFALQGWLKSWLFVHVGLTYALLTLAGFHALTALAFHGGTR